MKKNYSLLKQYLLVLTLLISTTIIVYSCKKDRKFSPLEVRKELIAEAKTYFEEEVLSNNLKLYNDPNVRHSLIKRADWEKAVTKKISVGDAVIVPILFDGNVFSGPANSNQKSDLNRNSYLMIYKDHGEKMHAEWVTLLPNKVRDKGNNKFSGIVVVESWNGKFNRAFAFNDAGKYIPVYISEAVTYDKSSYRRSVTCFEVEHWGAVTVGGVSSPKYLGSETFCSNNGSGSGNEDPGPRNNPVTEEEATPDEYITYYIDCHKDIDGTATIDPNCGCIGGNTGVTACKDIMNKTTDSCISKTVKAALDANKDIIGMIGGIISLFDASKTVTLNIYDGTTDHGTPGQYKGGSFVNNVFQANITLQTSYFKNSSKESVISTLIHESVHAYIHTSGSKVLEGDHEEISKKYIEPMAAYLQSYFGMNIKDAYSMAWSGVADSKAYIDAKGTETFKMSDGNTITKDEIDNLALPYKENGNDPQFKKGTPICN